MVIGGTQRLSVRVTERIRELCREQNISGRELARQIGKSHTWLQNRYSQIQPYDLDDLASIAEVLGVEVDELLGTGAYAAADFLPDEVRRVVEQFAAGIMAHYTRRGVTDRQRWALLRIVREAWKYVEKGMAYWEEELARTPVKEPAMRRKVRENGETRARR